MTTLQTRLADLITVIGTDYKAIWANSGAKADLTTTDKTTLVNAINEVNAHPSGADDSTVVHNTGTETIAGVKTFSSAPVVPNSSFTIAKTTGLQTALDTKPVIDDVTASGTAVYSSTKVNSSIATAVSNLVNGAGAALDTLAELATALGNDASFSTTIATALGLRLRVDAAQSFSSPQKAQGRSNIDAYGITELGDPDTDLVALYTTAKA